MIKKEQKNLKKKLNVNYQKELFIFDRVSTTQLSL